MVDCRYIIQHLNNIYGSFNTMYENLRQSSKDRNASKGTITQDDRELWKFINEEENRSMCKNLYKILDDNPQLKECLQRTKEIGASSIYLFCYSPFVQRKYR